MALFPPEAALQENPMERKQEMNFLKHKAHLVDECNAMEFQISVLVLSCYNFCVSKAQGNTATRTIE